ncbi:MAG: 50S ribosomal protein L18 [Candidatus Woesearchaeota archaeon]
MKNTKQVVSFRRRREGLTDYRKRLKLLLSKKPRLVIRRSLNDVVLQVSEYTETGDRILANAKASELKKFGWTTNTGNVPSAYLAGLLLAQKAKAAKVGECVADIGFNKSVKGARVYAALKGAIDGGLKTPFSADNFPSNERLSGKHIADYAAKLKNGNPELYKKIFSGYIKNNAAPEQIVEMFNKVKESVLKGSK